MTGVHTSWTGFVLLLVPLQDLRYDAAKLLRRVEDQIGADVVLADTVLIGQGPVIIGSNARDAAAVARALFDTTFLTGTFFAPSVVYGLIVVGDDGARAAEVAGLLARAPVLRPFPLHTFGIPGQPPQPSAQLDPAEHVLEGDRGGPDPQTVAAVMATVAQVMEAFERWPGAVMTEGELVAQRQAVLARHAKLAAAAERPAVAGPDPSSAGSGAAGATAGKEGTQDTPRQPVDDESASNPEAERSARLVTPRWLNALLPKPKQVEPTYGETLERIGEATRVVSLVYVVYVADRDRPARSVLRRMDAVALELDASLAGAVHETPVELSVFTAGRGPVRHRPLRPPGDLDQKGLPRLPADYFDLVDTIRGLLTMRQHEVRALARRGVRVRDTEIVFLSTVVPLADVDSVEQITELCRTARVSWIFFGVDLDLVSRQFVEAGVMVLTEHQDVVAELMSTA